MIVIKDMKMPESCMGCVAKHGCNIGCFNGWLEDRRADDCPLIEIKQSDDCVSRASVFETIDDCNSDGLKGIFCSYDDGERFKEYIKELPSVIPVCGIATVHFSKNDLKKICEEQIEIACEHGTCKDCKWWESENEIVGYCNDCKYGHYSGSWDIGIYRKTKDNFYCADFERKEHGIENTNDTD